MIEIKAINHNPVDPELEMMTKIWGFKEEFFKGCHTKNSMRELFEEDLNPDIIYDELEIDVKEFKCVNCGEKYLNNFCATKNISLCRWCSGEEK